MNKTLRLGLTALVFVTAALLIALVTGAIDTDQLTNTLGKSAAVIGVLVIAGIAVTAVNKTDK